MKNRSIPRPFPLYILLILLLALGVGGLFGGFLLTYAPNGEALQIPLSVLSKTPFSNYLIPGIILLIFNGFLPIVIAYGLIFQPDWRWFEKLNIYANRHWSWTFSLYNGIILSIWIDVQMLLLGQPYSVLQIAYSLWATVIIVFTMWPGVMRYYER